MPLFFFDRTLIAGRGSLLGALAGTICGAVVGFLIGMSAGPDRFLVAFGMLGGMYGCMVGLALGAACGLVLAALAGLLETESSARLASAMVSAAAGFGGALWLDFVPIFALGAAAVCAGVGALVGPTTVLGTPSQRQDRP